MASLARDPEQINDPGQALDTVLRSYQDAAGGDADLQLCNIEDLQRIVGLVEDAASADVLDDLGLR